jgi:putative ATPase
MDSAQAPLAERMRPQKPEEILGQDHLVGPGSLLSRALETGHIFSVIFWGPPGSGKTTLARVVGKYARAPFHAFSAVISGIKELRQVIENAKESAQNNGKFTASTRLSRMHSCPT